ncbi:uncharacterized protein LOC106173191 [Lingula anatina]|uniref:Uncharacterized protein LOC106173191 n=1 Tax=Lingula anatina TaxID=7574 RepID=A0A1S3JH00_LINAN|nr:uncharacterized protein LOC106173191 [Lingula anatina]|eukprot:XP_013409685.1 uncharacterized protein LOC106173191 [Lingula anatina]
MTVNTTTSLYKNCANVRLWHLAGKTLTVPVAPWSCCHKFKMMKLVVLTLLVAAATAVYVDRIGSYGRHGYGYNTRGYAKTGYGYQIAGRPEDYISSCGGNAYSTYNEDCCGGVIYNRRYQDCCAGHLVINKPAQCPGLPRVHVNYGYNKGYDAGYAPRYDAGYGYGKNY